VTKKKTQFSSFLGFVSQKNKSIAFVNLTDLDENHLEVRINTLRKVRGDTRKGKVKDGQRSGCLERR